MSISKDKTPNPFTAFRLLSLPILWIFALLGWQPALAIGLALAALSDVLDGQLAKKHPIFTDGRFDSLADKLLTASVISWLVLVTPTLFTQNPWLIAVATCIYALSLFVGWIKHKRVTTLHTHLGKLGGLLQAIFVFHTFFTGGYSPILFYLAVGLFVVASAEELAIQWVYSEIDDEVIRSILPYLLQRFQVNERHS